MVKTFLGDLEFHTGFKKSDSIEFCNRKYEVTIKAKAYFEEDGITAEQQSSLQKYGENKEEFFKIITDLALNYDKTAKERFVPKTLLFQRNGECALLCDDVNEPDEGLAICILPEKEIVSQDDYL